METAPLRCICIPTLLVFNVKNRTVWCARYKPQSKIVSVIVAGEMRIHLQQKQRSEVCVRIDVLMGDMHDVVGMEPCYLR